MRDFEDGYYRQTFDLPLVVHQGGTKVVRFLLAALGGPENLPRQNQTTQSTLSPIGLQRRFKIGTRGG